MSETISYKKMIEQYGGQRAAARALEMPFVKFKHAYRKQEGLCTRCGKPPEIGRKMCRPCLGNMAKRKGVTLKIESLKPCEHCQKHFIVMYERRHYQQYCSYSCKSQHTNSGKNNPMYLHGEAKRKYPHAFYQVRNQVLTRDQNTCQLCSTDAEKSYDVHHIDYCKDNNDLINLITLCKQCHAKTGGTQENRDYWQTHFSDLLKSLITP